MFAVARTIDGCRLRNLRPGERQLNHLDFVVVLSLDALVADLAQHASADSLLDFSCRVANRDLDPGPSAGILELEHAHIQQTCYRIIVLNGVRVAHSRHVPRGRL